MTDIIGTAEAFVEVWSSVYTLCDNAKHMTLTEASSLADLLTACDHGESADALLTAWIEAEIEDGEAVEGDWTVVDHELHHISDRYDPERDDFDDPVDTPPDYEGDRYQGGS
jgi:hypothetical protein